MRAIPIDTNRVRFIASGKAAGRPEYVELADGSRRRSGEQAKDESGTPVWVVDCLVDDPAADRAEIAGVKVSSHDEPKTKLGEELRFHNLVAVPYVDGNNRVAMSWRADGLEQGKHQPQAA